MKAKKAKPSTASAAKGSPTSTTADQPMRSIGSPMRAAAPVAVDDAAMTLEQREDHLRMLKMMAAAPK